MKEEMKRKVGSQKRLQELLGISRPQAWRIWTGKCKLTLINEKYLQRVLKDEPTSDK